MTSSEEMSKLLAQYGCGPIRFSGADDALYERHLTFDDVVALSDAGPRERFEAFARSVRDGLSQRWIRTEKTYEQDDPKRVYYLSLEYLIGRSLANNVTNLLLDSHVARIAREKQLDWIELLEQEPDAGRGEARSGSAGREARRRAALAQEESHMSGKEGAGKLGFLDVLGRLFRAEEQEAAPAAPSEGAFERLGADFDAAIRRLREVAERDAGPARPAASGLRASAVDRAAERQLRLEAAHRAIREDIEQMHARLGTGLAPEDLDALSRFLEDLDAVVTAGRDSLELLPRLRFAIATRLRLEAGELAVARLVALLQRAKLPWPDPTHYRPSATPDEVERSSRRRLAEIRESFLAQDVERTTERMVGIVRAWGSDYPDRGSPLWEEAVLEGVAAGLRGQLLRDFVEVLRREREQLLSRTEASVGKELAALQEAVRGGVRSIDQANLAVASALHALGEVVPEVAWQQVRALLPQARGEFAS